MHLELGKKSNWTFETCNGLALSGAVIAGEGGTITLREPVNSSPVKFYLGAVGAGFSAGFKLPKVNLPKLKGGKLAGGTGSMEAMTSHGWVFMAPTFGRPELERRDIRGGCLFIEGNLGFAWGGSGDVMLFGMNPMALAAGLGTPSLLPHALNSAAGYLVWWGMNFGFQAGGGITGYAGLLYA
jgi:hypothetical protein